MAFDVYIVVWPFFPQFTSAPKVFLRLFVKIYKFWWKKRWRWPNILVHPLPHNLENLEILVQKIDLLVSQQIEPRWIWIVMTQDGSLKHHNLTKAYYKPKQNNDKSTKELVVFECLIFLCACLVKNLEAIVGVVDLL